MTRRRTRKKKLDLGISEVKIDRIMNKSYAVCIKLLGQRRLFPSSIDGCLYRDGRCVRMDVDKPGDYCTNFLRSFYSSHRDILELSFSKNNGVYIVPRFKRDDPRFESLIREFATYLIRRSEIVAQIQSDHP